MTVKKYETSDEGNWEDLVCRCKNPAFVLKRRFISYHGNKFDDFSLVVYNDNLLIAALPACALEKVWYAHPGLPFVDLIMCDMHNWIKTKVIIHLIIEFLKKAGFQQIVFKTMPQIYKSMWSDEWLYFMRDFGARLYEQKLTTAIPLFTYDILKKNVINSSKQNKRKFSIEDGNVNLPELYALMKSNMERKYQSTPTHTFEDLTKLIQLFPHNIRCLAGYEEGKLQGGIILFIFDKVVKIQYLFSAEQYLADVLLLKTIELYRSSHDFFDLGTSNSLPNNEINYGNLEFKAKNGGKACIVESYELFI